MKEVLVDGHMLLTITCDERMELRAALLTAFYHDSYAIQEHVRRGERFEADYTARRLYKAARAVYSTIAWDDTEWPQFTEEEMDYSGSDIYIKDCPNCGKTHFMVCHESLAVDYFDDESKFTREIQLQEEEFYQRVVVKEEDEPKAPKGWEAV
jgi:hypothetical protein